VRTNVFNCLQNTPDPARLLSDSRASKRKCPTAVYAEAVARNGAIMTAGQMVMKVENNVNPDQ